MALAMSYIQLFQMLKPKIGEPEAEALLEYMDAKVKENVKESINDIKEKVKETNDQNLKVLAILHAA